MMIQVQAVAQRSLAQKKFLEKKSPAIVIQKTVQRVLVLIIIQDMNTRGENAKAFLGLFCPIVSCQDSWGFSCCNPNVLLGRQVLCANTLTLLAILNLKA